MGPRRTVGASVGFALWFIRRIVDNVWESPRLVPPRPGATGIALSPVSRIVMVR